MIHPDIYYQMDEKEKAYYDLMFKINENLESLLRIMDRVDSNTAIRLMPS